jgi:hypothetical protein
MLAHIALWAASVAFAYLTWAAWELAGEQLGRRGPYRLAGVILCTLALICARAA